MCDKKLEILSQKSKNGHSNYTSGLDQQSHSHSPVGYSSKTNLENLRILNVSVSFSKFFPPRNFRSEVDKRRYFGARLGGANPSRAGRSGAEPGEPHLRPR